MAYNKPTLIEIFTETHLQPNTLTQAGFFDVVPRLREAGFSEVEFGGAGVTIEVDPTDPEVVRPREKPRIRCWHPDRKTLAQVGEDLFVVNVTGEYPGWTHFRSVFDSAHAALIKGLGRAPAQSLNLSTIDRFRVAKADFTFGGYLNCGGRFIPQWYEDATESLDISLGRGFLQIDGRNRQLQIRVRTAEDSVQIELRATFHDAVDPSRSLEDALEALHKESTGAFEAIITDRTRHEVMEGQL